MKVLTQDQLFDYQVLVILRDLKSAQAAYEDSGTLDEFAWKRREILGEIVYNLLVEYYGDIDDALATLEK